MAQNVNAGRRSADYTSKSVQEALERAAADLRVPAAELEYTVIRDTTHTILGLVRTGEATIRVWLPQPQPAAPAEPLAPEAVGAPEVAEAEAVEAPEAIEEPTAPEFPPAAEVAPEPPVALPPEPFEEAVAEEEEEVAEAEEAEAPAYLEDEEGEDEEFEVPVAPQRRAPDQQQDLARVTTDVVTRLLDGMGLYAAVEVVERGGQVDPETQEVAPLQVNIIGDDLGVLIGRRGETLRDLQFLTRLIVSRKVGEWPNVVVDVEGYKARRAEALESLARRMADRVRATKQPVVLEPMPAYERRIVHMTLRDDQAVYTESTGEGESRKVQILPR
jgi:spoIIIJ-associated protein